MILFGELDLFLWVIRVMCNASQDLYNWICFNHINNCIYIYMSVDYMYIYINICKMHICYISIYVNICICI